MATITQSTGSVIRNSLHSSPIYRIPSGVRVYAVGDIHGRADLLKDLHSLILEDSKERPVSRNIVVYLGDYIDRGDQVREVLDILVSGPPDGFRAVYLRGNHEEMLLNFLKNPSLLKNWISMGGRSTLLSYKIPVLGCTIERDQTYKVQRSFLKNIPEKHLRFLRALKPAATLGSYFFVHAGVRPGISLNKQKVRDVLWIRDEFLTSHAYFGARIVHGHSIVHRPEILPNRINVDTGAYATGILSCAVIEEDRVRILSTGSNHKTAFSTETLFDIQHSTFNVKCSKKLKSKT